MLSSNDNNPHVPYFDGEGAAVQLQAGLLKQQNALLSAVCLLMCKCANVNVFQRTSFILILSA